MEKINQLSLLRESNTTLRSEAEANSKAAHDLRIKLQKVQSELEPLKERVRVLEAELMAREDHIHRLEEDNKRLKDRTEQILSKVRSIVRVRIATSHVYTSSSIIVWILLRSNPCGTRSHP